MLKLHFLILLILHQAVKAAPPIIAEAKSGDAIPIPDVKHTDRQKNMQHEANAQAKTLSNDSTLTPSMKSAEVLSNSTTSQQSESSSTKHDEHSKKNTLPNEESKELATVKKEEHTNKTNEKLVEVKNAEAPKTEEKKDASTEVEATTTTVPSSVTPEKLQNGESEEVADSILPAPENAQHIKPDLPDEEFIEDGHISSKEVQNVVAQPKIQNLTDFDDESEDGHFMLYMFCLIIGVFAAYLVMHNKRKIMGLVLEGRSSRSSGRARYRRLSQNDSEPQRDAIY